MTAHTNTPPAGQPTQQKSEVQAKQGTDKPKGMPAVVVVGTVGAALGMFLVWLFFFG